MSKNSEELKEVCPVCKGSGEVSWDFYRKPNDINSLIYSCGGNICRTCKGRGFIRNNFLQEYNCVWLKKEEKKEKTLIIHNNCSEQDHCIFLDHIYSPIEMNFLKMICQKSNEDELRKSYAPILSYYLVYKSDYLLYLSHEEKCEKGLYGEIEESHDFYWLTSQYIEKCDKNGFKDRSLDE